MPIPKSKSEPLKCTHTIDMAAYFGSVPVRIGHVNY